MALQNASLCSKGMFPVMMETGSSSSSSCLSSYGVRLITDSSFSCYSSPDILVWGLDKKKYSNASNKRAAAGVPNSNYGVPLVNSSCITRPLAEILRDLNKKVPENIFKPNTNSIPWCHANRMLSFYAPGWCGEIRNVIFSDNGSVTVVYRVTILGSDGVAHRESTGTVLSSDGHIEDPVAAAEEMAFCRACARFGLGLYLYHDDETL